jgi:hypothetical protein
VGDQALYNKAGVMNDVIGTPLDGSFASDFTNLNLHFLAAGKGALTKNRRSVHHSVVLIGLN